MINYKHPIFKDKEELANSISHGLGVVFGLVGIPMMVATAVGSGHWAAIVGSIVYGLSFLMVFLFSTLYHGTQQPRRKHIFKILDHISIYFLIAGSYTPFVLMYVYNGTGLVMLSVLWGLTLVGTIMKIWFTGRFNLLSTAIYLLMGWMLVFAGKTFFASLPMPIIILIAVGGALYTLGVIFYLWERVRYHHAVWHIFVLAAGICHFAAVYLTVS